jgi:hypothetical protein
VWNVRNGVQKGVFDRDIQRPGLGGRSSSILLLNAQLSEFIQFYLKSR